MNQKKLEKAEQKLKQKLEKKEKGNDLSANASNINALNYDSSKLASTSQALSRKAENASESNRSFDIMIENFDISFGNK